MHWYRSNDVEKRKEIRHTQLRGGHHPQRACCYSRRDDTRATATVNEAPTSREVHSMLSATSDVVPSSHFAVREQKVGEAKVTASKPQNHDSNQAHGLPHWSS